MSLGKEKLFMDSCLAIDVGKGRSCYGLMKNVDVTLGIRDGMETVIRPKFFRHTAEDLEAILKAVAKYRRKRLPSSWSRRGSIICRWPDLSEPEASAGDRRQSADYRKRPTNPQKDEIRRGRRGENRQFLLQGKLQHTVHQDQGRGRTQRSFHGR